jgi:5-methyltetrahydrofolate--homocysteine methyltransferase
LAENVSASEILAKYMIPAMDAVGSKFECGEYFVPELLLSGRPRKGALELVHPLLAAGGVEPVGRVVIGTAKGGLHDIGKNLVASMFEGGGFEVHDLGAGVSPERFVDAAKGKKADFAALSALLTVTMPFMHITIEVLRQAGIRDSVKIMAGGAAVTHRYAEDIGADGYGENAGGAVQLARSFVGRAVVAT